MRSQRLCSWWSTSSQTPVAEYIEASYAVSVSPAPVVEQLRSGTSCQSRPCRFASNSARVQRVSLHDTSSNLVQSTEGSMTEDSTDLRRVGVTLSAPAVTLTCSTTATRLRQRMRAVVHEFAESAGYERLAKACKVSGGKGNLSSRLRSAAVCGVLGHLDGCCGACREHCAGCTIEHLGWTSTCNRICRPSKRTGWRRRRLTR